MPDDSSVVGPRCRYRVQLEQTSQTWRNMIGYLGSQSERTDEVDSGRLGRG